MKKLIYLLLAGTLAFASCSKDDPAPIAVGGITLDKTQLTLKLRQSETLTATVTPEDAADKTVTWESSDPKIATVDDSGKVTTMAVGSATITARAGEKSATCAVTVDWPVETVLIKAGKFLMGSPEDEIERQENENLHEVTLTKDFYMGKYEVTNAQYAEFLNARKISGDGVKDYGTVQGEVKDYGTQNLFRVYGKNGHDEYRTPRWNTETQMWECHDFIANRPMSFVTWYGALAYAQWAGGTLPTEAQWEYACRAGTTTTYFFGDDFSKLGDYAVYFINRIIIENTSTTAEVGTKLPNPWGLYDMLGNTPEWCLDTWDNMSGYPAEPATDPVRSNPDDQYAVTRGGDIGTATRQVRPARRNAKPLISQGEIYTGIRVIFPVE